MQINSLLKGVNLYLVGMMGVGKTTTGLALANKLEYRFIDTDTVISQFAGQSIAQIFAKEGEEAFRQLESRVLAQVCAYTHLAIATGGGIVMQRKNWSYLHHGLVVWLDLPVELIVERLANDTTRPLLQDVNPKAKLSSLLEQRQPLYAQADLHIAINDEETPEQVAARVIEAIPSVLKQNSEFRIQNSEHLSPDS